MPLWSKNVPSSGWEPSPRSIFEKTQTGKASHFTSKYCGRWTWLQIKTQRLKQAALRRLPSLSASPMMPFVIQLVWNNKQFIASYLLTASLQHAGEAAQLSAGATQQRRSLIAVEVITVTCNYHVQRVKPAFKKLTRAFRMLNWRTIWSYINSYVQSTKLVMRYHWSHHNNQKRRGRCVWFNFFRFLSWELMENSQYRYQLCNSHLQII